MKRYEGMFLLDNAVVQDWAAMTGEIRRLLERIEAQELVCVKYDERKLAYEIKGRKRGTYVLTYFDADPEKITDMERDARISEAVLRVLVLRAENLTEERLKELQAHDAETPLSPAAAEQRRGDDRDDRPRDRRPRSEGSSGRPPRDHGPREERSESGSATATAEPGDKE